MATPAAERVDVKPGMIGVGGKDENREKRNETKNTNRKSGEWRQINFKMFVQSLSVKFGRTGEDYY